MELLRTKVKLFTTLASNVSQLNYIQLYFRHAIAVGHFNENVKREGHVSKDSTLLYAQNIRFKKPFVRTALDGIRALYIMCCFYFVIDTKKVLDRLFALNGNKMHTFYLCQ